MFVALFTMGLFLCASNQVHHSKQLCRTFVNVGVRQNGGGPVSKGTVRCEVCLYSRYLVSANRIRLGSSICCGVQFGWGSSWLVVGPRILRLAPLFLVGLAACFFQVCMYSLGNCCQIAFSVTQLTYYGKHNQTCMSLK